MNTIKPIAWMMEIPDPAHAEAGAYERSADAMRERLAKHVGQNEEMVVEGERRDGHVFLVARTGPQRGPRVPIVTVPVGEN
jgi:hypothetical protein